MAYKECDLFNERAVCPPNAICTTAVEPCKLKRSVKNLLLVAVGFIIYTRFIK